LRQKHWSSSSCHETNNINVGNFNNLVNLTIENSVTGTIKINEVEANLTIIVEGMGDIVANSDVNNLEKHDKK